MTFREDLEEEVADIFSETWEETVGRAVPYGTDLTMFNDCRLLNATVLYADLDDSSGLVQEKTPHFAAEVYKAFLRCASRVILAEGGEITAFDGDRVMAVYLGDDKNKNAVRTALKLNEVRTQIINPAITAQYGAGTYELKHVVGVDTSPLHVVKSGLPRGENDYVWVGPSANFAAKLCSLSSATPSWITMEVFDALDNTLKFSKQKSMWKSYTWKGRSIYCSSYRWRV